MRETRPSAGTRFTCTSTTDRKMPTRQRGAVPRPSSAGGTAAPTLTTLPSAGASTSPARAGATRTGSRKKNRQKEAKNSPSQKAQAPRISPPSKQKAAPPMMKGRPARCGGAMMSRKLCPSDMPRVYGVPAQGPQPRPWPACLAGRLVARLGRVVRKREDLARVDQARIADGVAVGRVDDGVAHAAAVGLARYSPEVVAGLHNHPPVPDGLIRQSVALE